MYKSTIGLEIHAELNTKSKMFCGCKNDPNEKRPNFNICPICAGHPGTLPVANEEAIKRVIKTGLALNCKISKESKFDRKNYFYPDLPKGYQISQYDKSLCENGHLEIDKKKIRIRRIHLEEDTGSLLHPGETGYSLVNFNRAGTPLMELVTEPDMTSGEEAKKFAEELQLIFKYLNVSDANMEKGLMRVEVNISLSKNEKLGTKVEIKNLNSFKVVERAIDYEIKRQAEILERGEKVIQETRGWHDKKEITFSQREKEEAHDYRYFPEPDLLSFSFDEKYVEEIRVKIPELPKRKKERFIEEYGLDANSVEIYVKNKDLSEYFEKMVSELDEWIDQNSDDEFMKIVKISSNYLLTDTLGGLNGSQFNESNFKISPENFAELIKMIYKNEISSKVAKMVLSEMLNTGVDPSTIVDENKWRQISDESEIGEIVKEIILKNEKAVADYRAGNQNVLQFLAGQVMAATRGTANPEKVNQALKKLI